ncbi:amidohydrolase family protein [Microbacterium maritypicum]|uniref:amidohydrolase family protein n=1 Tax=Microbacterium maritypicum TaxID=33918 RepID=UPI00296E9EEB|nr:amidohydrolase family protein [Microbacterium liquefaciens]
MRKLTPFDRSAQTAPVLLTAHAIHTADVAASTATAMLTDRGRILAIGTLADCEAAAERGGLSPERIDLGDGVVVPGFVDAHAHPLMFGQMMSWVDCGPEKAGSIPEIVALLKEPNSSLSELQLCLPAAFLLCQQR